MSKITITANGTSDAVLLPTGKANLYFSGASSLDFDSGNVTVQVNPTGDGGYQDLKQMYIDSGTMKWATAMVDGTNNGPIAVRAEPNSYLQFVTASVASAADVVVHINHVE